jgi:hypothetical protein
VNVGDKATPEINRADAAPLTSSRSALLADIALFVLCACLISIQIFVRPFIGLADNGDFPKVLGPLSLAPSVDVHHKAYFVPVFLRAPMYRWKSPLFSSEIYFGRIAVGISRLFGNRNRFDIRYLGAVHASFFLLAFLALLIALHHASWKFRVPLLAFVIWVFTDVAYVAYYNSFYSDAAAVVALFVAVALALLIVARDSRSWLLLLAFAASSLLFITSKGQHGILGFIPAAFIIWITWRWRPAARALACVFAGTLLAATVAEVLWLTPAWYHGVAAYNIVFYEIPKISPDLAKDFSQLGIPPENKRFVGSLAAMDEVRTREWFEQFSRRVSYSKLIGFYFHEPQRPLAMMNDALRDAVNVRAGIGNFSPGDGFPPYSMTHRFASWSTLRAKLFRRWPSHILLWYVAVFLTAAYCATRGLSLFTRRVAIICLAILFMEAAEFFISALADASETDRHLFLFHACTDISICFVFAALLRLLTSSIDRRTRSQ